MLTFSATPATQPARDANSVWKAPACTGATPAGTRRITGDKMQFAVPTGLRIYSGFDVDYGMNVVCAGKHCLSHGCGARWSSGAPADPKFFANAAEMHQREVFDLWSAAMRGRVQRQGVPRPAR